MLHVTDRPDGDRYRILFEHSSDAHFIFDDSGITDCNDATIALLGALDRNHVLALHPSVLSPEYQPDGQLSAQKAKEMDAIARAQGHHRFDWLHRKLNGEEIPVEVTLNSVEISGRPAMIAVWHDLTEIKRAESELRRQQEELQAANEVLLAFSNRLKQDLSAAARLQKALLPTVLPLVDSVRFAWTFRPCDELAGDILNIYQLDAAHIGFYVLDVSGHGVSAALLSVSISRFLTPHGPNSLLRSGPAGSLARPSEVLQRLNQQFSSDHSEQFFTLFYGVLELATLRLTYCNAGHPHPLIVSAEGHLKTLQNSFLPIGVVEGISYEDRMIELLPGDRMWLYSDGLIEAMNDKGEQYGSEKLSNELRACSQLPLHEGVDQVVRGVEEWTGHGGPQDDISLVTLHITG